MISLQPAREILNNNISKKKLLSYLRYFLLLSLLARWKVSVFGLILCCRTFTAGEDKRSFILLLMSLLSPSRACKRGNILLKFPLSSACHSSSLAMRGSVWKTVCTLCGSVVEVGWKILLGLSCAFFGTSGLWAKAYSSVN